jgi:hypothetical protein
MEQEKLVKTDGFFTKSRQFEFLDTETPAPYLSVCNEKIWLKSNLAPRSDGGERVALWERHAWHENGEIFIADNVPHLCGQTEAVCKAVIERILIVVDKAEAENYLNEKLIAEATGKRQAAAREAEQIEFFKKYHLAFGHRIGSREAWAAIQKSENTGDGDLPRNALQDIRRENIKRENNLPEAA